MIILFILSFTDWKNNAKNNKTIIEYAEKIGTEEF